jgi:NADH-quinone oxidoreductase subunit J
MVINFAFYTFSGILILSALAVVSARNPVYSVLFLILAFVSSAGLFLMAGAEFLAMLLIIVYVGAVALLFLFVIMMLNIDYRKSDKKRLFGYLLPGLLIAAALLAEVIIVMQGFEGLVKSDVMHDMVRRHIVREDMSNSYQIGRILYTDFFLQFQLAGIVLLVAMIGAVVLAHRKRDEVKRQNVTKQVTRKRKDSVKIVKILSHKGI